jgi:hypothetical protein
MFDPWKCLIDCGVFVGLGYGLTFTLVWWIRIGFLGHWPTFISDDYPENYKPARYCAEDGRRDLGEANSSTNSLTNRDGNPESSGRNGGRTGEESREANGNGNATGESKSSRRSKGRTPKSNRVNQSSPGSKRNRARSSDGLGIGGNNVTERLMQEDVP